MKCPNCTQKISLFSKTMNSSGKVKVCPHCEKVIRSYVSLKFAAIYFIPIFAFHVFVFKPIFAVLGLSTSLAIGILAAVLIAISMRLKEVE